MHNKMNWENVPNYKVTRQDMSDFRDFSDRKLLNFMSRIFNFGILDGNNLSVGAGLDIQISAGSLLFQNPNVFVDSEEGLLTLGAADADNPRVDRVEAYFEEEDDRTALNDKNIEVVVTRKLLAKYRVIQGTPALNPVSPPKTAGSISLGICRVESLQTQLTQSNLVLDERFRDIAFLKDPQIQKFSISNNSVGSIPVLLDSAKYKAIIIDYDLYRRTDVNYRNSVGQLIFSFNESSGEWNFSNPTRFDDAEVVFSAGNNNYIEYESNNLAGSAYVSEFSIIDIKRVVKS